MSTNSWLRSKISWFLHILMQKPPWGAIEFGFFGLKMTIRIQWISRTLQFFGEMPLRPLRPILISSIIWQSSKNWFRAKTLWNWTNYIEYELKAVLIYAFFLSFGFSLICVWKKISAVHFGTGPQYYFLYESHQFSNFLRALLQIQIYVLKLTLKLF